MLLSMNFNSAVILSSEAYKNRRNSLLMLTHKHLWGLEPQGQQMQPILLTEAGHIMSNSCRPCEPMAIPHSRTS